MRDLLCALDDGGAGLGPSHWYIKHVTSGQMAALEHWHRLVVITQPFVD